MGFPSSFTLFVALLSPIISVLAAPSSDDLLPREVGVGGAFQVNNLRRDETPPRKAIVYLSGNSTVVGTIIFEQTCADSPVQIFGHLEGLNTSASHGYHIHAAGNLTDGCTSAGAHFNPFNLTHGAPEDETRHVGDLGNLQIDECGKAVWNQTDKLISLQDGLTNIVGRAVVIHKGTDDLGKGGNEDSLKTGNAGDRSACGVIGWA